MHDLVRAGLLFPGRVMAAQPVSAETAMQSASVETVSVAAQETETDYLAGFRGELDFSGLDDFFGEEASLGGREPLRFSGLVDTLLSEGLSDFDGTLVVRWLADTLFYEISENRRLLAEVVVLAVAFSIFKNFSGAFKQSYIAEISFFLVYGILAVLLLQSFTYYEAIVEETLQKKCGFHEGARPHILHQHGLFVRNRDLGGLLPDSICRDLSDPVAVFEDPDAAHPRVSAARAVPPFF